MSYLFFFFEFKAGAGNGKLLLGSSADVAQVNFLQDSCAKKTCTELRSQEHMYS
jgi:hypothetical protein